MRAIDRFERFGTHVHNGQDFLKNHIFEKYPVVHDINEVWNWDGKAEYVWVVDPSIKVYDSFPWYFKPKQDEPKAIHSFPYVFKKSRQIKCWDKVKLVPTAFGEYAVNKHSYICGDYDVYKGKERFDIFYIGDDRTSHSHLIKRFPDLQVVDTLNQAQERSNTDMFWLVYDDVLVRDTFKFSYDPDEWSLDFVHAFGNGDIDQLDGVVLVPKNYTPTAKELDHRFFVKKKEIRIMASKPRQYDSFEINNYEQYLEALEKTTTELFWGVPQDIEITDNSVFDFYINHQSQLRKNNHVWLNGNKYDGVVLYSKHAPITQKEIEYRFLANRIEHEKVVSQSKRFEQFTINTYDDYLEALKYSTTNMFWGIPSDVIPCDDFKWDNYFDESNVLDRNTTHVFLNRDSYDGIVLYSTSIEITKKEIEHRFYLDKKEHAVIASQPKPYDKFTINSYEDYTDALYNTTSELFWGVPSDVNVAEDFNFDLYFSHHNRYDREINHVFLNGEHRDGIVLFSRHLLVSEKEVEHRFYIKKKEWDIVASTPKSYPVFTVNNFNDYQTALDKTDNEMFFMINDNIEVDSNFDWNFYISYHNQYERKINHVWKNGEYFDGISLTTKHKPLSQREIEYRFFAVKKEYEEVASVPKPYDIVFISNGETNADENYELLKQRYPDVKRVDRVKGIHQAHIEAAKLCDTEMFWVVDGDAEILDTFNFDYQIARYDVDGRSTVYVWRSYNPVNSLVYGYGGVKLLPTDLTRNVDVNSADMTTSISKNFKAIAEMSNKTAFNTDPFSAWRSGFRECVKLASRTIDRQNEEETEFRLNAWCTKGADKPFGEYAIAGAILGREYGERNKGKLDALKKINDFNWLQEQFNRSSYPLNE
jgi:hypothetical protein